MNRIKLYTIVYLLSRILKIKYSIGTKRFRRISVDHQFEIYAIRGKVHDITLPEDRPEFIREHLGIFRSHPKRDHGSHISQDGPSNMFIDLMKVLVDEDQVQAVFARL